MLLPRIGVKLKLVPFDPKYARTISSWYYDVRYHPFFRAFPDIPYTEKDFENFGALMSGGGVGFFMMIHKETDCPMGIMTYSCLKAKSGVFRFGIMMEERFQHQTYAIEGIILLGFFLIEQLGCRKYCIEFLASDKHIRRIAEQGGFIFEYLLKEEAVIDGKYVDEVRYVMPKDRGYELYGSYYESLKELSENQKEGIA